MTDVEPDARVTALEENGPQNRKRIDRFIYIY